jgi:hypothetical protein
VWNKVAYTEGGMQAEGVWELLSSIFGPKWDKVTAEWRKQQREELNDL